MENLCLVLKINLAILADSIEVGQGLESTIMWNSLGLALIIVVICLLTLSFVRWVKENAGGK